ncbi:universal stress protein [Amycolatopsis minnesotensis]|uniref:Universal stress protein n=2 Tax=Amycolatopsis minnesotensis TaxID=337894 RepID=A0ABN2R8S1_9PSEU
MARVSAEHTIVVGIDLTPACLDAARWAAREAVRRGVGLVLLHASAFGPREPEPGSASVRRGADSPSSQGYRWLERAATEARNAAPRVRLTVELACGIAPELLAGWSRTAELVVVGSHGLGGLSGVLVGSVALKIAARAWCPVVVVRGSTVPEGTVVVGVDASPESDLAWEFAVESAASRMVPLVVAHAWHAEPWAGAAQVAETRSRERQAVEDRVVGWRGKYPDVEFRLHAVQDRDAARVLLGLSGSAQLIVIGSRGRGPIAGGLLGSTGNALLSRAPCPVVLAHERKRASPASPSGWSSPETRGRAHA